MKNLFAFFFFLLLHSQAIKVCGQNHCNCTESYGDIISCDTTFLKNRGLLYYQYTCDSVWLTLQQENGSKVVLYSDTTVDLFPLNYRLGYYLIGEYDSTLLFRYGCPANGPCNIAIVHKRLGRVLVDQSQREILNEIDIIDAMNEEAIKASNYLLYFDEKSRFLNLFFLKTGKRYAIPTKSLQLPSDPDYTLDGVKKVGRKLQLTYKYYNGTNLLRFINLDRYPE